MEIRTTGRDGLGIDADGGVDLDVSSYRPDTTYSERRLLAWQYVRRRTPPPTAGGRVDGCV